LNWFHRLPDNLKGIVLLMLASFVFSLMALLDYVRLLWATLLGFLVFDQLPGMSTWFGAVIVVTAAIFTIYRETRRKSELTTAASGNLGD